MLPILLIQEQLIPSEARKMNIYKKNNKLLAYIAGATLLLATASANTTVMTFTDKADPSPDQLISFSNGVAANNQSYSFTHSIIADQDGAGTYWSGVHTVTTRSPM